MNSPPNLQGPNEFSNCACALPFVSDSGCLALGVLLGDLYPPLSLGKPLAQRIHIGVFSAPTPLCQPLSRCRSPSPPEDSIPQGKGRPCREAREGRGEEKAGATELGKDSGAQKHLPRSFSIPGCSDYRTRKEKERPDRGGARGNARPQPPPDQT